MFNIPQLKRFFCQHNTFLSTNFEREMEALSSNEYLSNQPDEAVVQRLLNTVSLAHGDLVLSWHKIFKRNVLK